MGIFRSFRATRDLKKKALFLSAFLGAALLLAACDGEDPTGVTSVTISPRDTSIEVGATQQYTLFANFADGGSPTVTGEAAWVSANTTVATISGGGLATGNTEGSTPITATYQGFSDSTTLTVTASTVTDDETTITAITLTPDAATVEVGDTASFTATAEFDDGATGTVTDSVDWSSDNESVATVTAAGVATGVAEGSTSIFATDPETGFSGSATITVITALSNLASIEITPEAPAVEVGNTLQLTATGTFADSTTADITDFGDWTSGNESVAAISTSGVVTGVAEGAAELTFSETSSGLSTTVTATVILSLADLDSITLTPSPAEVDVGATLQFTATGTFADSATADLTNIVDWTSGTESVATIDGAGLATGVAAGTSFISAFVEVVDESGNSNFIGATLNLVVNPPSRRRD